MAATIVAGFDGSPSARQAVRHAATLARGGRLVVVHARETAPAHLAPRWKDLLDQEHVEHGQAVLESIVREGEVDLSDVDLETRLTGGKAAPAVLAVAHEVDADAIVVGSHGYSAFSAILGSVSNELVRKSDLPVTIIPPLCADRLTAEELAARAS